MNIYGLKVTHDCSFAKISDGRLEWLLEAEKFDNNERHSDMYTRHDFDRLFIDMPDTIVVDGWGAPTVEFSSEDGEIELTLGAYNNPESIFRTTKNRVLDVGKRIAYTSYAHVTNHVTGSYCCSPFADTEPALVSVWDGGVLASLFLVEPHTKKISYVGAFMPVSGRPFAEVAKWFGPLKRKDIATHALTVNEQADIVDWYKARREYHIGLDQPGTLMAYAALGNFIPEISDIITDLGEEKSEHMHYSKEDVIEWYASLRDETLQYSDEDIIATFYQHYGNMFVTNLVSMVKSNNISCRNMILTGGCALNIKWNSQVRDTGFFDSVWVPPIANDSGTGLGAACTEMICATGRMKLDWNVYSGPPFKDNYDEDVLGWSKEPCSLKELASFFKNVGQPVVFIRGNAEIGPRALGHRSILAPATCPSMKDTINDIKGRQSFRPVAPICLEEHAPEFFTPGTPDPYMLFDHKATDKAQIVTPAVIHLDNTARLQTINKEQEPAIYELLTEYHRLTGVPLLCNTSANMKGRGFFNDFASIIKWGQVNFIWFEGNLYRK